MRKQKENSVAARGSNFTKKIHLHHYAVWSEWVASLTFIEIIMCEFGFSSSYEVADSLHICISEPLYCGPKCLVCVGYGKT